MVEENFIKIYEKSFKENWDLPALTDYNTRETFTYGDMARQIAVYISCYGIARYAGATRLLLSGGILRVG